MSGNAACAHLRVSYRTEPCDGPDSYGVMRPNFTVRGWWECDSGCGYKFAPLPTQAEPTAPSVDGDLDDELEWLFLDWRRARTPTTRQDAEDRIRGYVARQQREG